MTVRLDPLVAADLDALRPLWLALHTHHQKIAPTLAPYVSDEVSWHFRRKLYQDALSDEGFGFVAREGLVDVGYLVCIKRPMDWNATFAVPPMLWELVTLYVSPLWRGKGVGTAMLDAMDACIAQGDVRTKLVGVIPGNDRAVDLYKSRGFVPTWLTLTRFERPSKIEKIDDSGVWIELCMPENIDALKDHWLSLHHHHQAVSPHLGPWVNDGNSWSVIRELFLESARKGLLFLAMRNDAALGLACAAIYDLKDVPEYADTWATGEKIAETKFLVVFEGARGTGIGTSLMNAVERELERRDVKDHFIGAIEPNQRTIQFYRARGFCHAWLELTKFNGTNETGTRQSRAPVIVKH